MQGADPVCSSPRRPNARRPEPDARPRPKLCAICPVHEPCRTYARDEPRVRLLGRRVRGGPPPGRVHGVGADRRPRPPATADRLTASLATGRCDTPCLGWRRGPAPLRRRRPRDLGSRHAPPPGAADRRGGRRRRRHRPRPVVVARQAALAVPARRPDGHPRHHPHAPCAAHRSLDDALDELGRRIDGSIFTAHNAAFDASSSPRAARRRPADDRCVAGSNPAVHAADVAPARPRPSAVPPARRRLRTLRRRARAPARRARRRRGDRSDAPPPARRARHHRRSPARAVLRALRPSTSAAVSS